MTMLQVVEKLQSQGHNVTYRVRTDGGILITHLDGKKFTGATGNQYARGLVGAVLSEKRRIQTSRNVAKYIKKEAIEKEIKKKIQRVQRLWKKNQVKAKGRITTRKARWNLKEYGYKETMKKLQQAERYALGYAYEQNVEWLIERLERMKQEYSDLEESIDKIIRKVRRKKHEFKEDWISAINEIIYRTDISGKEKLTQINAIIQ